MLFLLQVTVDLVEMGPADEAGAGPTWSMDDQQTVKRAQLTVRREPNGTLQLQTHVHVPRAYVRVHRLTARPDMTPFGLLTYLIDVSPELTLLLRFESAAEARDFRNTLNVWRSSFEPKLDDDDDATTTTTTDTDTTTTTDDDDDDDSGPRVRPAAGAGAVGDVGRSAFAQRTDETSAAQYFQFYGYLCQQQNMLQDYVRTSTYQRAIHGNLSDFRGRVVLDVGAGSAILSFFAIEAGAKCVYAVEASDMAVHAQRLIDANGLTGRIVVIAGRIEEICVPQPVDVIVSEPMGFMLYNERMLESFLHAKKWLKPGGKMYPSRADLHVAPFRDDLLYAEQVAKANFWCQHHFHGVDLSVLRSAALTEYFRQPIVDTFDIRSCLAKSVRHTCDFLASDESDLHRIAVPLEFYVLESGPCHGLAFWFDIEFAGSDQSVWLSTSPTEPLTHWYQVRCLLHEPMYVKQGQLIGGRVVLVANKRQSYDVTMELHVEGTTVRAYNSIDLKNPYFRYSGGMPAAAPAVASTAATTTTPPPPPAQPHDPMDVTMSGWTISDVADALPPMQLLENGLDLSVDVAQKLLAIGRTGNGNGPPILTDCIVEYEAAQPNIHPGCISSTGLNGTSTLQQQHQQQQQQLNETTTPTTTTLQQVNCCPLESLGGLASSLTGSLSSVTLNGQTTTTTDADIEQQLVVVEQACGTNALQLDNGTGGFGSGGNGNGGGALSIQQMMQQLFRTAPEIVWPQP